MLIGIGEVRARKAGGREVIARNLGKTETRGRGIGLGQDT